MAGWAIHCKLYIFRNDTSLQATFFYSTFTYTAVMTILTFIPLSPIMMLKQPICKTLYCRDDWNFLGKTSVPRKSMLERTPRPSQSLTYEILMYQNLITLLKSLVKPTFLKMWWQEMVLKGFPCCQQWPLLQKFSIVLWLPLSIILLIMNTIPFFSLWIDYLYHKAKVILNQDGRLHKIWRKMLQVLTFIMVIGGIFFLYLMIWNFMVGSFYHLTPAVIRHITHSIFIYTFLNGISSSNGCGELESSTV